MTDGVAVFGVLKPCAHGAAKYGIDPGQWQAHMCGLCLGLRDGQGQLARAATNTDAIVLSVLTEAQSGAAGARTTAGPCPLRGMRRASVVVANAPGVQLAATAALLLGAAKIRDHVDDGDAGRLARRPMRRVAGSWSAAAQTQADRIGLDVGPLLTAIDSQSALEALAAPITLDQLTGPTQLCAATLFGHTATLAGRPENVAALSEIGRHLGRIAHLADAIEDLERDRLRGRFNPPRPPAPICRAPMICCARANPASARPPPRRGSTNCPPSAGHCSIRWPRYCAGWVRASAWPSGMPVALRLSRNSRRRTSSRPRPGAARTGPAR
ncbi:DUF5685 family protein [Nocardia sp. MW-W600-9]